MEMLLCVHSLGVGGVTVVVVPQVIVPGSVLHCPALVQVMVVGPVSESPLSHW